MPPASPDYVMAVRAPVCGQTCQGQHRPDNATQQTGPRHRRALSGQRNAGAADARPQAHDTAKRSPDSRSTPSPMVDGTPVMRGTTQTWAAESGRRTWR